MRTYYIEYQVYEDIYRYGVYVNADCLEDALDEFKENREADLKRIERCETAW